MTDEEKREKSYLDILSRVNKSESKNLLLTSKENLSKDYISLLSNSQKRNKNELSVSSIQNSKVENITENTQIKFKNKTDKEEKILTKNSVTSNSETDKESNSDESKFSKAESQQNIYVDKIYNNLNEKIERRISKNPNLVARLSLYSGGPKDPLNLINHQKKASLLLTANDQRTKITNLLKLSSGATTLYRGRSFMKSRRSSFFSKKTISTLDPNLVVKYVKKSVESTSFGKYFKYLKWFDFFIAALVSANIILTLIDNELYYSESDHFVKKYMKEKNISVVDKTIYDIMATRTISTQENLVRFMNVFLVIFVSIGQFWRYIIEVKILRSDSKLTENEGLWASGLLKYMILEIAISLIVYPPYLNNVVHGKTLGTMYAYNLNSLISAFVLIKFYNILTIYTYISKWTSETARSICNKHNVKPGVHFAIKAELKNRPYQVLSISMIIITIFFGFLLRTFEFFINKDPEKVMKGENNLQLLANSMWLGMVTMTTVGYGDYFPQSHLGRFIGVVSCVIGLLLVSLIVVSLGQISAFNSQEEKAYYIIKKVSAVDNAIEKARNVIRIFLKLRLVLEERAKYKLSSRFIIITQLKKEISTFKNDYKLANSYVVPNDELLKLIRNNLKTNMNSLNEHLKKLEGTDLKLKSISNTQAECLKIMEGVEASQKRIGNFLVEFNNNYINSKISENRKKNENGYNNENDNENAESNSLMYFTSKKVELKNPRNNNKKTDLELKDIFFGAERNDDSEIYSSSSENESR
jgi:hypothetical protein